MAQAPQSSPDRRAQIAPAEVRRIAERQHGVIARAELLAAGVSGTGISRAVSRGWLVRIHPGVYTFTHTSMSDEARVTAALLYAGPGAALSHTSAAWWWELIGTSPSVIHLATPHRRQRRAGTRLHLPRRVERLEHRGLPVTPVDRTLLDLATVLRGVTLRRALAEADHRGLLKPAMLIARCRRGQPGSAALRAALHRHLPELAETLSVLEDRFLELCERHSIPTPRVNVVVAGFKVDALWTKQRLVVELDGHATHARAAAIEADRRRELTLRTAGYEVRRYTWAQITKDEARVVADLIAALAC